LENFMADISWRRKPVVAGAFYPGIAAQLRHSVENFLTREREMLSPRLLLVPHAGYIYSGATAGRSFACSELPKRLFILGPNHTGMGAGISVWPEGSWMTPLGEVVIDADLAERLLSAGGPAESDREAHLREHSIEVQLPFIQVRYEGVKIVPVCVGVRRFQDLIDLGESLARACEGIERETAFVVSSDMNHYESAAVNREKDEKAISAFTALDPEGLYGAVLENEISMCGFAPAVAALHAAKLLGAENAGLIDYTHSGMMTGDDDEVVSYAGMRAW